METYTLEGETYYYKNGKWLDSSYLSVPFAMVSKLNKLLNTDAILNKDFKEVCAMIDKAKADENYVLALNLANKLANKSGSCDLQMLLPRITSLYRAIGNPKKAIAVADEYIEKYDKEVFSPMLFTSVAAAYCDLEDYETARIYADKAYSMGKTNNQENLMLVYSRIDAKK